MIGFAIVFLFFVFFILPIIFGCYVIIRGTVKAASYD